MSWITVDGICFALTHYRNLRFVHLFGSFQLSSVSNDKMEKNLIQPTRNSTNWDIPFNIILYNLFNPSLQFTSIQFTFILFHSIPFYFTLSHFVAIRFPFLLYCFVWFGTMLSKMSYFNGLRREWGQMNNDPNSARSK